MKRQRNNQYNGLQKLEEKVLICFCLDVSSSMQGKPIEELNEGLNFIFDKIKNDILFASGSPAYEAVYEIFHDAFDDFTKQSPNVFFSGKNNILKQPEYNNVDEIKRIVNKFDDEALVSKIEENGDGINVYIGEESEFDPNVTVIKSKYKINGEEGTIAIVGPKGMEYDKVIGLLKYINEELEKDNK